MSLPRHALRLVLAYAGAVLAATAATVALILLWVIVLTPANAGGMLRGLPAMIAQGALITAVTALPGWVLAVLLSELFAERRRWFFAVSGGVTAVFAHGLLAYSSGSRDTIFLGPELQPIVVASLLGGLIGGLAHWRVAGRHAGAWRA
jgi:hypothetical protein